MEKTISIDPKLKELIPIKALPDGDMVLEVLYFWFGTDAFNFESLEQCTFTYADNLWRNIWFAKGPAQKLVDQHIRQRFENIVENAGKGNYNTWENYPISRLALIVVLDQFSRNIYRGNPKTWAFDTHGLRVCKEGITNGHDQKIPSIMKTQYYMPLVHSENIDDQELSWKIYCELREQNTRNDIFDRFKTASSVHRNSVLLFGRFPERNNILGRESTEREKVYIQNTLVIKDLEYVF